MCATVPRGVGVALLHVVTQRRRLLPFSDSALLWARGGLSIYTGKWVMMEIHPLFAIWWCTPHFCSHSVGEKLSHSPIKVQRKLGDGVVSEPRERGAREDGRALRVSAAWVAATRRFQSDSPERTLAESRVCPFQEGFLGPGVAFPNPRRTTQGREKRRASGAEQASRAADLCSGGARRPAGWPGGRARWAKARS